MSRGLGDVYKRQVIQSVGALFLQSRRRWHEKREDEKEKKYMETHCAGRASGYQNEIQTGQAENV